MTEPRVREATTDDADRVHALAGELAGTVGDSPPSRQVVGRQLRQLLEEPRAAVLVAEDREGVVIGAVSLWIKPDLAHGDVAVEVPMLVVSEDRRREGVGRLLIEEVRRLAAENDAGVIELVATTRNRQAREFYSSLGFVETNNVTLEFVGDVHNPPDADEG